MTDLVEIEEKTDAMDPSQAYSYYNIATTNTSQPTFTGNYTYPYGGTHTGIPITGHTYIQGGYIQGGNTTGWIPTESEIQMAQGARLEALELKLDAMMKVLEDLRETIEMIAIPVTCP